MKVQTFTPANVMKPIGPYSHIAKAGPFITISATAGVDPATGELAGPTVQAQARQILASFRTMLESVGASLEHVMHVQVYLLRIEDFDELNRAYSEVFTEQLPARVKLLVASVMQPMAEYFRGARPLRRPNRVPG